MLETKLSVSTIPWPGSESGSLRLRSFLVCFQEWRLWAHLVWGVWRERSPGQLYLQMFSKKGLGCSGFLACFRRRTFRLSHITEHFERLVLKYSYFLAHFRREVFRFSPILAYFRWFGTAIAWYSEEFSWRITLSDLLETCFLGCNSCGDTVGRRALVTLPGGSISFLQVLVLSPSFPFLVVMEAPISFLYFVVSFCLFHFFSPAFCRLCFFSLWRNQNYYQK